MSNFIPNNEHFLKRYRNIRNELLNRTDKYILSDYPISLEHQMIIKTYRYNNMAKNKDININPSKGISIIIKNANNAIIYSDWLCLIY